VKRERYIYDIFSFLAEAGGLTGILLGCSILGLVDFLSTPIVKVLTKLKKRDKQYK